MSETIRKRVINRVMATFSVDEAKRVAEGIVQAAQEAQAKRLEDDALRLITWSDWIEQNMGKQVTVRDQGLLVEVLSYFETLTLGKYDKELRTKLKDIAQERGLR